MKKRIVALTALLLGLCVLLSGCSFLALRNLAGILAGGGGGSSSDPDDILQGDPVYFETLTVTTMGMSAEVHEIEIRKTEDGVVYESFYGPWYYNEEEDREDYLTKKVKKGTEVYETLSRLLGGCGVRSWDGFAETDPNILDGESFHLEIKLSDGDTIYARGTNAYPRHYRDLIDGIRKIFEQYKKQRG